MLVLLKGNKAFCTTCICYEEERLVAVRIGNQKYDKHDKISSSDDNHLVLPICASFIYGRGDVNVDQGCRWTNSLLSSYMFVAVIIIIMIIIITSLFTKDNILSTYKHLSKIWSSFQTNAKQCATS